MEINSNDKIYGIEELKELTGLGRTKIYQEINAGKLAAKKLGSKTVVVRKAYLEWIESLPNYLDKA